MQANPRQQALKALLEVESGRSLSAVLEPMRATLSGQDAAFLQQLTLGVLRQFECLETQVNQLLKKPFKPQDQDILLILMMACYQIQAMRVPDHAAVDQAVKLVQKRKKPWAKALVNGVLRNFIRQGKPVPPHAINAPHWLAEALQQQWPDHWQSAVAAMAQPGPLTLRVHPGRISRDAMLQALADAGIEAAPCSHSEQGIRLAEASPVQQLPGYDDGWFWVQDEAAQLCTPLMHVETGQRVLDACAAPGGKTCGLLADVEAVSVTALDLDQQRLPRMRENLARLQLQADIHCADAREPATWWNGELFDRILLDAPCSASGVIRRHPDIKRLRKAEDIPLLAQTQLQLVEALWPLLKPGGLMLYATCSVLNSENDAVVHAFMSQHSDAQRAPIEQPWGFATEYGRQWLPQQGAQDGFYYARLRKQER